MRKILLITVLVLAGCDGGGNDEAAAKAAIQDEVRKAKREAVRAQARSDRAEAQAAELREAQRQANADSSAARLVELKRAAEAARIKNAAKLEEALVTLRELQGEPADPLAPKINTPPPAQLPLSEPADPLAGIPSQPADVIQQKALRDWPGDERMQLFETNKQAKGWREMNRYETQAFQNMPYKEKTDLLVDVRRKWPMDFAMQSFEFGGQAAAWQTLETWERSGIPGLAFKDRRGVLDNARKKYGTDYKMVLYEAKRTAAQ
jgi:hypothetical protein